MWWLADSLCKRHAIICKNFDTLFAHGFRFYFTPLKAVLFTFPSRYLFTIGCWLVFSLTGWSPLIHMRFLVSHITLDAPIGCHFVHRTFTFCGSLFQAIELIMTIKFWNSHTFLRFGLFQFRSPLLLESLLLYFPCLTEMFHFRQYCRPSMTGYTYKRVGYPIRRSLVEHFGS